MAQSPTEGDRVQDLLDALAEPAIILLDAAGAIVRWPRSAAGLHGYAAEEILGRAVDLLYTDEDRRLGRPRRLLAQATARGRVDDEGWRLRKDGSRFWADVVISALRDPAGALTGFAKAARDFTDRHLAGDALRASEERFRLMVDTVEDYAIFMLDPEGRVATWNAGARRIKGWAAAEIVGRSFAAFYGAEDVAAGRPARALAIAARDGRHAEEGWRVRKDGSSFWASVVMTAVRDGGGRLLGFVKVTRDLSERRRAEQEQLRLARAEEAVRVRDELMLLASHELRTPVTALQLQLHSLLRALPDGDRLRARVERALRSGHRLVELVEALLDVSRIATGQFALVLAPADLAALLDEEVARMQRAAAARRCTLTWRGGGELRGVIDRARVAQVVQNLIDNALKYGAGQPVDVSLARDGGDAVIVVRDRGPGIAAADATRIFERYERAAPLRHYGGLGLGLYVARHIARAHGGSLAVHDADGGGAAFTLRLPLALAPGQPEA
jgi:PAS domain S-box-containing protein